MLYKTLIRPLLEYSHTITYPRYEKDRKLIEGVQRRATKLIPALRDLEYTDRINALGIPIMYYHRDKGDMIECYKFTHNKYKSPMPFEMDTNSTRRGHSLKLFKPHVKTSLRIHFFTNRVINHWNSLPEEIVSAPTLNTFKNRLDKLWKCHQFSLSQIPVCKFKFKHEDRNDVKDCEETILQA